MQAHRHTNAAHAQHKRGLDDLRPNATINCYYCLQPKPQASAVKFYAHMVCAGCAAKVRAKPERKAS